ncbi:hypothetical protein VTI28DRAFT_8719 [Corynascus sepedonium]
MENMSDESACACAAGGHAGEEGVQRRVAGLAGQLVPISRVAAIVAPPAVVIAIVISRSAGNGDGLGRWTS